MRPGFALPQVLLVLVVVVVWGSLALAEAMGSLHEAIQMREGLEVRLAMVAGTESARTPPDIRHALAWSWAPTSLLTYKYRMSALGKFASTMAPAVPDSGVVEQFLLQQLADGAPASSSTSLRMRTQKQTNKHTTRLLAMFEVKVFVAPLFEFRMEFATEGAQCVMTSLMKMRCILFKTIIRRQVHAATEPPDRIVAFACRSKKAHIHVHGGCIGITGMKNQ